MFVRVRSGGIWGVEGFPVEVEVDISQGLPSFSVVGLPDNAVKEARERVRAAIKNSGFSFPLKRITVNLSPSDIKKQGTFYDLPMAIGILAATGVVSPQDFVFLGELSLDGKVKRVSGILPVLIYLKKKGFKRFVIPKENLEEASLVSGVELFGVSSLKEAVDFLNGKISLPPRSGNLKLKEESFSIDLKDVKGQELGKRALEVCAAGLHHLLFVGSAGAGKSMLAKRIVTIAPPLDYEEFLEVAQIYSVAGKPREAVATRPFQSPHHTSSEVALVGGGNPPKPGAVSLAHKGFLLLDEIAEFPRRSLEALRQPLEDGVVHISRASSYAVFPAEFTLIGTMNPCPCGNYKNPYKVCTCTEREIKSYNSKLSEPIKDRIELKVWLYPLDEESLMNLPKSESSEEVRKRVVRAYEIQKERGKFNSRMTNAEVEKFVLALMDREAKNLVKEAVSSFKLSARSYFKLLKVVRTVADLEASDVIRDYHVAEALQFITEV
ncbi:YifB family Mg chelatase-like AAA ATPase [Aquifex sp.]